MNNKKSDIVLKSQSIEDWKIKDEIIKEMRNYVKVKIISLQPRHNLLKRFNLEYKQRCNKLILCKNCLFF